MSEKKVGLYKPLRWSYKSSRHGLSSYSSSSVRVPRGLSSYRKFNGLSCHFKFINCDIFQGAPASDQRNKVIEFHRECLDAHGVVEDALHDALDGTPPEEHEFYVHMLCAIQKAKLISSDGTVNTDNFEQDMKDVIDADNMANVAAITRKCLIQRDNIMDTVKQGVDCFIKEEHNL